MIGAEFSPVNENKKSWFCISKIEFHDTKQYVPKEFSHIFSTTEQTHQAEKIKNRRKNEVVRPFEPSSTVVHPCTTVEGDVLCTHETSLLYGTTAILGSSGRIASIFLRGYLNTD